MMRVARSCVALMSLFAITLQLSWFSAVAGSSTAPTTPTSIDFSSNELKEMKHVWRVIRKSCRGCWSGSMSAYAVSRNHELVPQKGARELNFRLQVSLKQKEGAWTVWNIETMGDQVIVPLRCNPQTRPTQLKIGFSDGIILRIPQCWTSVPRVVFEIGFWDPMGDGMRRTAVAEYVSNKGWLGDKSPRLKAMRVVQMQRQKSTSFVGNTTDPSAIEVLPLVAPFDMTELNLNELEAVRSETVDLQSMKRTRSTMLSAEESNNALDLVVSNLLGSADKKSSDKFTQVLPCGMCASMPQRLGQGDCAAECIFAHQWQNGLFQALHVEYDGTTAEATKVALYSFRRKKN